MQLVRSALLGCAVGIMAFAGIQSMANAAEPVRYVKICSLYGEGFYYIPGTDTCIKVGGYVRAQAEFNANNSGIVYGSGQLANSGKFTITNNDINYTARAVISFETLTQTAYGTLQTYIRVVANETSPSATGDGTVPSAFAERAFIKFAGFTFGRTRSFFDIFSFANQWSYIDSRTSGDTGYYGVNLAAYTHQFGNGVSFSVSAEDPKNHYKAGTLDASAAAFQPNGVTVTDSGGVRAPDMIANLRIDQPWGYAAISAVAHDARGAYYGATNITTNGQPADTWGWAVAGGGQINLANGDAFGVNLVFSQGATGFATKGENWQIYGNSSVGVGWTSDGIFESDPRSNVQLTRAFSVNAAYQHVWSPNWRTSLYGGYVKVFYNDTAKNIINSHLPGFNGSIHCGVAVFNSVWPPIAEGAGNSCSPDFSVIQAGSRTQFSPVPQLDIGLDVFFTRLNTAYKGAGTYPNSGSNAPRPPVTQIDDQNVWSAIFRWQRNFYP